MSSKKIRLILCLLITAFACFGILGTTRRAYAAVSPGCYDRFAGDQLYRSVACPPANQAGVQAGKCFTRDIQPRNPTPPPYAAVGCDTINPGQIAPVVSSGGNFTGTPVDSDGQKIYIRLEEIINILSALVGVAVVASIIVGGIQYTTAGADPQKVGAAKNRIFNAMLALFAYLFVYAFLQYLVPGGLF